MTPEQHKQFAVEFMRHAIASTDAVSPTLRDAMKPTWAERRIRTLEQAIKRFCEFNVDDGATVGMGDEWNARFRELAETIDFDPEAHGAEGYARDDV